MAQSQFFDRVTRLGDIATELDACESADEIHERTVSAADHVLTFDAAIACTVEDDVFVPKAASGNALVPGEPLSADEGIAGRTVATGESVLVEDVRECDDARPTGRFRSLLSLPYTDRGVLQFHADDPGAFTETDRQFGELLVFTVSNALERVRYERALSRERDQFAALFENVPDAALAYRIEGGRQIVEAVNSSFVGVFDAHGEDVVNRPVSEVVETVNDEADPDREFRAEVVRRTDIEVIRRTPDGPRPFLLRNVPMRSSDDAIRGYLIYTDLTAIKERERELERKNQRLDQFASMVSHDLRNPLNVASGYLELAKDSMESEELEAIESAHRRMERLIDDVLSLARVGESVEDLQPVHLGTAAREAWNHVSTTEATLTVDGDVVIQADPGQLSQLLENLFRNAVEHGGPSVSVDVESTDHGFAVTDDGPGIPAAERDRIFESEYTTTEANTGLGLAIVEQISRAHGWDVTVTDGPEGGARFSFTVDEAEPDGTHALRGETR